MFFLLASKALSIDFNFCFRNQGTTTACPDGYDVITMNNFNTWTDKVSSQFDPQVTLHFIDSLPNDKQISPNNLKFFVKKLVVRGQTKDVSVTLNTSQNFVMAEFLELDSLSVVLSTTTLSCDQVTLKDVSIKSTEQGDLTCDALELIGDIASIVVFKNKITATKAEIKLNKFELKESVVLDFTDMFASDFKFTDINSNMEWTGFPNMLRMKFTGNNNNITFKVHNVQPSIKVEHTIKNVKLTLSEIAAVGASLIRCIKFTVDGAEVDFPFSIDSVVNTITIEAKNKATVKQGGDSFNAVVNGASYTYVVSSAAKEAGALGLGTEVNIIKEDGNEQQKVSISTLTYDSAKGYAMSVKNQSLTMEIPSYTVNEPTDFNGAGAYRFNSLVVNEQMTVATLVLDSKTTTSIVTTSDSKINAGKINATNALVNIDITDDIQIGHYDLISTSGLDCSQIKFTIDGVQNNKYELMLSDATLTCSASGVTLDVTDRSTEKNDKFCIGNGICPGYYTQITTQEKFDTWKTLFPAGHKNISFVIINDIGDTTKPLVFDFTNLGKDLTVEFESKGGLKSRKLEISSTSFGGIIDTLTTNIQLGISGDVKGKIKLPNLNLNKATLTDDFQNNLDIQYQNHYVIEMTSESKLNCISASTTDIYLPSAEATILFEDNLWNIELNDLTSSEFNIMSYGQKVYVHPVKSAVAKFTLQCKPTSTYIKPLYIDASGASSSFIVQGSWPENFTGIHFVNPGSAQFYMNSKTVPATFDFTEESKAISINSNKDVLNITSPIHAYSGVNLGGAFNIDKLELSKSGTIQSEDNKPISIKKLILNENVEARIPVQASIGNISFGKLSKAVFTGKLEEAFPGKVSIEYSLTSMPYIQADEILREDVEFNFSYVKGSEAELNKYQMIALAEIPFKVVCGKNLSCESWKSIFTGNETFTPKCQKHEDYKCYELTFIPNYYIDYSINGAEIAIITIIGVIVVGGILACVFVGCRSSKKEEFTSTAKVDGQLLLENDQIQ
jgi:hypothetical protein